MGQKTNPRIFQLGKTKKWNFLFEESKKPEFATYSTNHIKIKKFVVQFFNDHNLSICKYNLLYSKETLTFFISYYLKKKDLKEIKKKFLSKNYKFNNKTFFLCKKAAKRYFKTKLLISKKISSSQHVKKMRYRNNFLNKNRKKTTFLTARSGKMLRGKSNSKLIYKDGNKCTFKENNRRLINQIINSKFYNRNINKHKKKNRLLRKKKIKKILTQSKVRAFKMLKAANFQLEANYNEEIFKASFLIKMLQVIEELSNKKLDVSLNLHQINNKNIGNSFLTKARVAVLKKKLTQLWQFSREKYVNESLQTIILFLNSPHFIDYFTSNLAKELQNHKRQHFFLKFIKKALTLFNDLKFCKLKNIKIQIKGRFNGAPRSKVRIMQIGEVIPLISAKTKVYYSEKTSYSANGTFGVKVWLSEKED